MTHLARYAFSISAAAVMLVGCGGSQPMTGARSTGVQPATRSVEQSLQGHYPTKRYYLAKFITEVGNGLPESSFCFRFTPSGSWSNTGSENFNGTYLTSGKELFASAVWLPSPAVYLSLHGSVNANQGSGTFIVSNVYGDISGGGRFAMTRAQKSCN